MLHRCSLAVQDPQHVVAEIADLVGGSVEQMTEKPGGYRTRSNDGLGTSIEVLPSGTEIAVNDQGPPDFVHNYFAQQRTATRITLSMACSVDQVERIAERNEWPLRYSDRDGFEVLELWIEGSVLIELFSNRMLSRYLAAVGAPRIAAAGAEVRKLDLSVDVAAPPLEVWSAWTDPALLRQWWGVREARVDLRIGGVYDLEFPSQGDAITNGSQGCRILSYVPGRLLSFTFEAPAHLDLGRDHTWVVVGFESADVGTTASLEHCGFLSGEKWDEAREYFRRAWRRSLHRLQNFWDTAGLVVIPDSSPADLSELPTPSLD